MDRTVPETFVLGLADAGRQSEPPSSHADGVQPDDQMVSPAAIEGSVDVQIIDPTEEEVTPEKKGNHCATEASFDDYIMIKATGSGSTFRISCATEALDGQDVMDRATGSDVAAKSAA